MPKNKIFISYRTSNTPLLSGLLKQSLEEKGIENIFLDTSLNSGDEISTAVKNALADSKLILFLINRSFTFRENPNDDWVVQELRYAMENQIPVHVVLFPGAILPHFPSTELYNYTNKHVATTFIKHQWKEGVEKIVSRINKTKDIEAFSDIVGYLGKTYSDLIAQDSRIQLTNEQLIFAPSIFRMLINVVLGLISIGGFLFYFFKRRELDNWLFQNLDQYPILNEPLYFNILVVLIAVVGLYFIYNIKSIFREKVVFHLSDNEVEFAAKNERKSIANIRNFDVSGGWFFKYSRAIVIEFEDKKQYFIIKAKNSSEKEMIIKMIQNIQSRLQEEEERTNTETDQNVLSN